MRGIRSLCLATTVVLAACGGGGGGGGGGNDTAAAGTGGATDAATVDFPVADAVRKLFASGGRFTLGGTSGASNYSMVFTFSPGIDATFEGAARTDARLTIQVTASGAGQPLTFTRYQDDYYDVATMTYYGTIADDASYTVASATMPLPATARHGGAGPLYIETRYASAAKTTVQSTAVNTWTLTAVDADSAWFCIDGAESTPDPAMTSSGSDCYRISAAGTMIGLKTSFTNNGGTTTFQ